MKASEVREITESRYSEPGQNSIRKKVKMAIVKVTESNFEKEVLQAEGKVLVDFWAAWCGPCQMLSPIVEEVAAEVGDVKVGKVNVDEEPVLAIKYGIASIPALLVFENGEVVNKSIGYIEKDEVLDLIK